MRLTSRHGCHRLISVLEWRMQLVSAWGVSASESSASHGTCLKPSPATAAQPGGPETPSKPAELKPMSCVCQALLKGEVTKRLGAPTPSFVLSKWPTSAPAATACATPFGLRPSSNHLISLEASFHASSTFWASASTSALTPGPFTISGPCFTRARSWSTMASRTGRSSAFFDACPCRWMMTTLPGVPLGSREAKLGSTCRYL
mmetsp:Transcript_8422/g.19166  ORF Transcript_8422/g.19166 Transcript_8422/m.19166 type:complete len:203 (-) Transcript_8422:181-789(-)